MISFDEYCNMMDRRDDWTDKMCRPSLTERWVSDSAPSTLQIDPDTIRSNVKMETTMFPDHMAKRYHFFYGPDADGVFEEIYYTVNIDEPCTIFGSPEYKLMKREQIDKIVERVIEKRGETRPRRIRYEDKFDERRAEQKRVDAIKKYNINPATKKEENTMAYEKRYMVPTVNGGVDITDIQIYNNKVVKVVFSDVTFTKAVCGENDHFDLDIGITICVIKKMAGKNGHKWYNNLIRKAHKVMEENEEAENKVKEFQASVKETRKKEQERRKAGKEKAKQEQIDIHSETILKALKEWTEKQEGLKRACGPAN